MGWECNPGAARPRGCQGPSNPRGAPIVQPRVWSSCARILCNTYYAAHELKIETRGIMTLEREWMRGAAPLAVLTLLERREMYGYELVEALERDTGGLLAMGQSTVYPLLYNLEARGHVEPISRTAPSGRRRKYYRITAEGRAWLVEQRDQWDTLVKALGLLGVRGPDAEEAAS